MARYLIVAFALLGCALADDSGYAAPQSGYGAPAGYAAPSAPADNYGVPTYTDQHVSYETEEKNLFDLSKLQELLPFFLAVFVAIIFAQLLFPLLGALFTAKATLLTPLGATGITLINAILAPLNLSLCTITPLAVANGRDIDGRSLANGFNIDPETVAVVSKLFYKAVEKYNESD